MSSQIYDSQATYAEFTTWKEDRFILGDFLPGEQITVCCQISDNQYVLQVQGERFSDSAWIVYDVEQQSHSDLDLEKMLGSSIYDLNFLVTDEEHAFTLFKDRMHGTASVTWMGMKLDVHFIKNQAEESDLFFGDMNRQDLQACFQVQGQIYLMLAETIYRLDNKALVREIREAAKGEMEWVSISLEDVAVIAPVFDLTKAGFALGALGSGMFGTKIVARVQENTVYLARIPDSLSGQAFCRVLVISLPDFSASEVVTPWFKYCDLGMLCAMQQEDLTRMRTLFALWANARQLLPNAVRFELSPTPFWFFRDRILFSDNMVLKFDLDRIDPADLKRFSEHLDLCLYDLFSDDSKAQRAGISLLLQQSSFDFNDSLAEYFWETHKNLALEMIDELADQASWKHYFADNAVKMLRKFPNHLEKTESWLTGTLHQRGIAVRLLQGRVEGGLADCDGEEDIRPGPWDRENVAVFPAEEIIPSEAMQQCLVKTLAELRAIDARDGEADDDEEAPRHVVLEILEEAARAAALWGNESGRYFLRFLARQGIADVSKKVAEFIGDQEIHELKDDLLVMVESGQAEAIAAALVALGELEAMECEDMAIAFLGHANEDVNQAAVKLLRAIGTRQAFMPLFISSVLARFCKDDENFRNEDLEDEAIQEILQRIFGDDADEDDIEEWSPEILARLHILGPIIYLWFLKGICQRIPSIGQAIGDEDEYGMFVDAISRANSMPADVVRHVAKDNAGKLMRRRHREMAVADLVRSVAASELDSEFKLMVAVILVFSRRYLDFRKQGPAMDAIQVHLRRMLEPVAGQSGFQAILARMALVQIGFVDWSEAASEPFRNNAWQGWPRLAMLGGLVLRDTQDADHQLALLKNLLRNAGAADADTDDILNKAAAIDPKAPVAWYEEGLFTLSPMEEALLYGRIGDRRGYDYVMANAVSSGSIAGLHYLGDFGGEEALPVLEKARELGAPAAVLKTALEKIQRRSQRRDEA